MKLRSPLPTLTRYTFGTGRLGAEGADVAADIKVARAAMDAGVWFHTSSDYAKGGVFKVLRAAFAEAPSQRPPCIIKVYCETAETGKAHIEEILENLGVERIDIAQLCCHADFAEDFRQQGPRWELFRDLQTRGVIGNFVTEIFAVDSTNALEVAKDELVDGYTYYYNLIDRQIGNELDGVLREKQLPVLALRTVGGLNIDFDQIETKLAEKPDDRVFQMALELKPLFIQSGSRNWTDFNVRFQFSQPNILTTIGATRSLAHLETFLESVRDFQPLDQSLSDEVIAIHRRWFKDFGLT